MKYQPKNTIELEVLLSDESIYLGDIDTSLITDMSCLFANDIGAKCPNRKDFSGISSWDVSKVTDMSHMFEHCYVFNENISVWDVSFVKNMERMFDECNFFAQDISSWDVSGCENMSGMFSGCYAFNQPLNSWNMGKVRDMSDMFSTAETFN
ncbi:BspA family leucine-rich repeat surface protein [Campylobacter hyointestinalis]|uniref:BspA family leucine-rich repeat surface protein n=1 Tax=Campylobacter hyointestinalis TaxID=198 RepID=A0A562XAG6_CAMHY|nr:BspA family leucine-rich repeat surface protein [Campylobacter hyointestinalis]TWO18543.1 BspA family leucine-rich repeat surface protein [Campylobacter hyointestinalis]